MFDELNDTITMEEIMKAIRQLKNSRSDGPDKFLNDFFFFHSNRELLLYLHTLFN